MIHRCCEGDQLRAGINRYRYSRGWAFVFYLPTPWRVLKLRVRLRHTPYGKWWTRNLRIGPPLILDLQTYKPSVADEYGYVPLSGMTRLKWSGPKWLHNAFLRYEARENERFWKREGA